MKIKILRAAELDLQHGADFYESQNSGVGVYFSSCLVADIELLRTFAGVHAKIHGFHRMIARRFPYSIYYKLEEGIVAIYAVLDCRRDPEEIQQTLEER